MAEEPQGEWKKITIAAHLKGRRRDPKYFPAAGEICLFSGPNCDDANGYTWIEVEVLWTDELFVVTRHKDCWPEITKHELALFEPKPDPLYEAIKAVVELGRYDTREQTQLLHGELKSRGLEIREIGKA